MTENGQVFTPPNLVKRPAYLDLKPGDPWTFIYPEPIAMAVNAGEAPRLAIVGDLLSKWFDTSEPGRFFRITAINGQAYETAYVGFEEPKK